MENKGSNNENINRRRENIILRIASLTPAQFDEFLKLYFQQETELSQHDPVLYQTSA